MNCHECGTPSAGGSFCVNCGTSFQAAPTNVAPPTTPGNAPSDSPSDSASDTPNIPQVTTESPTPETTSSTSPIDTPIDTPANTPANTPVAPATPPASQPTVPPVTPPTTPPAAQPFTPAPVAESPEVANPGAGTPHNGGPAVGGPAVGGPGVTPPQMTQNQTPAYATPTYPNPAYPTPTTPMTGAATASAGGMPPTGYSPYPNGAYLPAGPPPKKGLSTGAIWAIVSGSVAAVLVIAVGIFAFTGLGDSEEEVVVTGNSSTLDTLWLACSGGDFQACDDLYFEAPLGSDYQDFGDTCGNRNEPAGYCVDIYGSTSGSSSAPSNLGNDPVLDQLADRCADGDFGACDDLFWQSPLDSDYEDFGARCGNRNERAANQCVTLYGTGTGSGGSRTVTGEYGSDAALDRLWDSCSDGNFGACDDLFFQAPSGSTYKYFGDTCGLRNEPAGLCASIYG